jgi:acyl-CoA synthetase (AMP-forming)/AMP-acid ligase II
MAGDRALDLGSLRLVVTGGEPVRLATIRAFESRFDLPGVVRPAYGLSEATLAVTAVAPGEPLAVDATGNVSCGRPLPGFELRVVDANGADCGAGEPGEIRVKSESLFSGYFEPGGPDTGMLREGWLATGDWGRLGAQGELYVLGRRRNLLKHGGATYAPRELEDAATEVAGVLASAAIALRDRARGEELPVLVVERATGAASAPAELARAVAESVRRELGILPGEVLIVAPGTLPRTDNGKLRHGELRRLLAAGELESRRILCGRAGGWAE